MKFILPLITLALAASLVSSQVTTKEVEVPASGIANGKLDEVKGEVIATVSLQLDGVEREMKLVSGQSALSAAVDFVETYMGVGTAMENNEPTKTTLQLAELLVTRLNSQKLKQRPITPLVSFNIKISEGNSINFDHYDNANVEDEAVRFCEIHLAGMDKLECKAQITEAAVAMIERDYETKKSERKVVFETAVTIDDVKLAMTVAEGESASEAADFFCRELRFSGDERLKPDEMSVCKENVTQIAGKAISDYMSSLRTPREPTAKIFSVSITIAEQELPLGFVLNENPTVTTQRFCKDQWEFVETVLVSNDVDIPISEDMCVTTLYLTVAEMVYKTMQSPEGQELLKSNIVMTLPIELKAEKDSEGKKYGLDVLDGQSSSDAVEYFMRIMKIEEKNKKALMDVVNNAITIKNNEMSA